MSQIMNDEVYKKIKPGYNWGYYLNCGSGDYTDEKIFCGFSPTDYKNFIKTKIKKTPSFIGACCGSSPDHIKENSLVGGFYAPRGISV